MSNAGRLTTNHKVEGDIALLFILQCPTYRTQAAAMRAQTVEQLANCNNPQQDCEPNVLFQSRIQNSWKASSNTRGALQVIALEDAELGVHSNTRSYSVHCSMCSDAAVRYLQDNNAAKQQVLILHLGLQGIRTSPAASISE